VEDTGFIGSDAVAAARAEGTAQRLAPFALTDRGIPRQGNAVLDAHGAEAGTVTSGTLSPCLDRGVGMAYVRSDLIEPGTAVEIDVRGKRRRARVEARPLLDLARRGS
jgi:aminomethyltransferase